MHCRSRPAAPVGVHVCAMGVSAVARDLALKMPRLLSVAVHQATRIVCCVRQLMQALWGLKLKPVAFKLKPGGRVHT